MAENSSNSDSSQGPVNPFAPKWIVKGVIAQGSITQMVGKPGHCKSWIVDHLGIEGDRNFSDTGGEGQFLGLPIEPCFVVLIDEDTPSDNVRHRLHCFNPGHTIDLHTMEGFTLRSPAHRYRLKHWFQDYPADMPKMIIMDCLQRVAAGVNLDSAAAASELMGHLQEIRSSTPNLSIVIVHHTSLKKLSVSEASDPCSLVMNSTHIVSGSDSILFVSRVPVEDETLLVIKPHSRRFKLSEEPIGVRLFSDPVTGAVTLERVNEDLAVPSHAEYMLYKLFPRPKFELTVKDINVGSGLALSLEDIRLGLISLVKRGVLMQRIKPEDMKSHKVTYSKNPAFDPAASFYGRRLIAEPLDPRKEEKK